ncbi:MAG: transposase [Pyrinomonadaceae bacterium]
MDCSSPAYKAQREENQNPTNSSWWIVQVQPKACVGKVHGRTLALLNHHLVFATCGRQGVFTSALGQALSEYWLRVASRRGFAIDQISVIADHVHSLVRIVPRMSIEECALLLLNNGQHFIGQNFPQTLV